MAWVKRHTLKFLDPLYSGADTMGHGGARAPHFSEWLGTGGHRERTLTGRKLQVEPADRPGDMCHDNTVIQ